MRRDRDPHADWTSPQKRKPPKPPRAAPKPRPQDVARAQEAGRAEFVRRFRVSRETMERLDRYVALLTAWQDRINLVAPSTIGDVWMRHIADSIVLDRVLPPFTKSVDLGSGAGLPGLVIAACRPESARRSRREQCQEGGLPQGGAARDRRRRNGRGLANRGLWGASRRCRTRHRPGARLAERPPGLRRPASFRFGALLFPQRPQS